MDPGPATLRQHADLRAFWDCRRALREKRDGGRLPARSEFELIEVPAHLVRGLILVEVRAERYFCRFAGEVHYDNLGFECTRHHLDDLPLGELGAYWEAEYAKVRATGEPSQGELALNAVDGRLVTLNWSRLPLSEDGRVVDMILGYDSYR